MEKRLKRSKNQFVAGVCAGLADYLNWDPTIVRILYALFTIFSFGSGVILYIICWLVMPQDVD